MTIRLPLAVLAITATASVGAVVLSETEITQAARSLSEVESQAARARSREAVLTGEISKYSERIRGVERRLAPVQARWEALNAELGALQTKRRELTAKLDAERARLKRLEALLKRQQGALAARVSAAYRQGDPTILQVLLQSGSVSGALSVKDDLERITSLDQRLITGTQGNRDESRRTRDLIRATRAEVWRTEKRVAAAEAEARIAFDRVNAEKLRLVAAKEARRNLLASVQGDRRELEAEARGLRARSLKLANAIRTSSVGLPSSIPVGGNGTFSWPVSGPVVSGFGPRWGRMHEGIDIAVGTGVPIGASGDGTVIVAGWTGGYGNLVVVSHGSLSTAYAHMSRVSVSIGQRVTRGQVLGAVGCTGHCFGPHVHFEVRINGTAVNPVPYL